MRRFEFEVLGMRSNTTDYAGGFSLTVHDLIKGMIFGKVLHLFSGGSLIGNERVDGTHPNATCRVSVEDFISSDERDWDWVLLDPPYKLENIGSAAPHYDMPRAVSSNIRFRRSLEQYLRQHAENCLWLDICAPLPRGFRRQKIWFLFPGGYRPLRVLTWLKREMKPLL